MSKLLEQINTAERKTYSIKDFGRVVTGKTPSKDRPDEWGGGVDFITPTDIKTDDKFYINHNRKLSDVGEDRFERMIVPPNSILVTCIGTIGKVIMNKDKALTNQQINTVVVENEGFDRDYAFYRILSLVPLIKSLAIGSTMPIINKSAFEEIEFEAPDLLTQNKISSILSAYDAKIENNNGIIKNLETMAQTIFDEWFINFRFPGYEKAKFVDSELGEIPEGWEVLKLGDIFDIKYGRNLPTSQISIRGSFPVYGAGGVIGFYEKKNVDEKVILITCRGNGSGTIWRTNGEGFVTNNSFIILPSDNFNYINFISTYFLLKNSNISSALSGSAQPQITIDGLSPVETVFPQRELLDGFQRSTTAMFNLIDKLLEENIFLKLQRDQLLKKLI
ncbi:MAG: restriction endonuclease subunit S [Parcubacteria group bacterium]